MTVRTVGANVYMNESDTQSREIHSTHLSRPDMIDFPLCLYLIKSHRRRKAPNLLLYINGWFPLFETSWSSINSQVV